MLSLFANRVVGIITLINNNNWPIIHIFILALKQFLELNSSNTSDNQSDTGMIYATAVLALKNSVPLHVLLRNGLWTANDHVLD